MVFNISYIFSWFQCDIQVTDQGYPQANIGEAKFVIDIVRTIKPPSFSRQIYLINNLTDSVQVNLTVGKVEAELAVPVSTWILLISISTLCGFS